MIQTQEMAEQL